MSDGTARQAGTARSVLPFGSCSVHNPVFNLANRSKAVAVWKWIRSRETIYSHTAPEFIQLTDYLRGELWIEKSLRRYIFSDCEFEPGLETRAFVDSADLVLLEVCTSELIRFDSFYLHRNQFPPVIVNPMLDSPTLGSDIKKAVRVWWDALLSGDEQRQLEAGRAIINHLPAEIDDEVTHAVILEARLHAQSREELFESLQKFREVVGKPLGFVIHYRRFMPDGRPVSWPPRFRSNILEFAQAERIPVLDPDTIVAAYGPARVLGADFSHYREDFIPHLAEEYLDFFHAIDDCYNITRRRSATDVAVQLNEALLSLHAERVAQNGIERSGLFAYYEVRMGRRELVDRRDASIAEIILRLLPRFDSYYVIRAGLGELAFVLADVGLKTVASDPERNRFEAIDAGKEHLRQTRGWPSDRLTTLFCKLPEPEAHVKTLCVAAHALFGAAPEDDASIPQEFSRYNAVLFEPRTLFRLRESIQEQQELIERFRANGFAGVQAFPFAGLVFCAKSNFARREIAPGTLEVCGITPPEAE